MAKLLKVKSPTAIPIIQRFKKLTNLPTLIIIRGNKAHCFFDTFLRVGHVNVNLFIFHCTEPIVLIMEYRYGKVSCSVNRSESQFN